MKLLRNLILILFLFITSTCAFAGFEGNFSIANDNKEITLSVPVDKHSIINHEEDNSALLAIKNNQNLNLNNKRHNSSNGSNDLDTCLLTKQKQNLLEYIYTKSYLDNKQKTALLPLLSQIQPHAP